MRFLLTGVLALVATALPALATAQSLGTFTWQLQPFCNRVTVTLVQQGASYTIDGFDDQCGAAQRAPVLGGATVNPDGSVTVGFATVVGGGTVSVHVNARVTLPSASGTWQDSIGNTGNFVLSGAATGSPRPLPTVFVGDGTITTAKLAVDAVDTTRIAPGAVGAADINDNEVQRRVGTACPSGQLMTGVNVDGTVTCQAGAAGTGDITAVAAGAGLSGGGTSGDVSLAIATAGVTNAMLAADAVDATKIAAGAVGTADVDATQIQRRVGGNCTAGSAIRVVNQDGTVTCEAGGSGDITGVTAGAGLSGGALSGDATLAIIFAGSGAATTAARSDHAHDLLGNNTGVGSAALASVTSGTGNTALGNIALTSVSGGSSNTAVGNASLRFTSLGSDNTAVGALALTGNQGDGNTALGRSTLIANSSGSNNVAIGTSAGGVLETGSNNIYIQASAASAAEAATLRVGSAITRAFIGGIRGVTTGANDAIPVVVDSNGQLGTVSSSRRTKDNIADLGGVSRAIFNLRPVQFTYKQPFADGSTPVQYGLIAEEVSAVLPELVAHSKDGQIETVKYHVLPTLLLAEVQRLERERAAMAEDRDALAARVAALERMLSELSTQLKQR